MPAEQDELFDDALRLVVETGYASIAFAKTADDRVSTRCSSGRQIARLRIYRTFDGSKPEGADLHGAIFSNARGKISNCSLLSVELIFEAVKIMAIIIDGAKLAQEIRTEIKNEVKKLIINNKEAPGLAVIQIGADPASTIYVRNKIKACAEVEWSLLVLLCKIRPLNRKY